MTLSRSLAVALAAIALASSEAAARTAASATTATAEQASPFFSEEDGWVDVSGFLDEKYGFLPIVRPITEPAVGFGAAGGLAFLSKPLGAAKDGLGRPDITAVMGLGTENGTWAAGAFDMRYWADDRVQTQAGIMATSINLDFYGVGESSPSSVHPLEYNVRAAGGLAQVRFRPFDLQLWGGLGYAFARTDVEFSLRDATQGALPDFEHVENVAALTPALVFDSRDTMFTPTSGTFAELRCSFFSDVFGGDQNFERLELALIQYIPLHPLLILGLRADLAATYGDAPFYLNPYVGNRGAPAARYMAERVASGEAELRWQFWGRWSLVGFAGVGTAWNQGDGFGGRASETVVTGGGGFRYEIARDYKIHMGLDVAVGPDGWAIYVVVGSAWSRA